LRTLAPFFYYTLRYAAIAAYTIHPIMRFVHPLKAIGTYGYTAPNIYSYNQMLNGNLATTR